MEGGMKTSSVMRFEDLFRLWQDSRSGTSILELLGIAACAEGSSSEKMDSVTLENLCEKLRGTWWEVIWPTLSARHGLYRGVRCRYLADSLQDAMRLYPNAGFPAHGVVEDAEDFGGDDDMDETLQEPIVFEPAAARKI
jgi:hypothetical protein